MHKLARTRYVASKRGGATQDRYGRYAKAHINRRRDVQTHHCGLLLVAAESARERLCTCGFFRVTSRMTASLLHDGVPKVACERFRVRILLSELLPERPTVARIAADNTWSFDMVFS